MPKEVSRVLEFGVAVLVTLGIRFCLAATRTMEDLEWFAFLKKPDITPPLDLFNYAWTWMYIGMGMALYAAWKKKPSKKRTVALVLLWMQIFLNSLWSFWFFKMHNMSAALVTSVILFAIILLTMHAFYKLSKVFGYLMIPYFGFVFYLLFVNAAFLSLNG